MKKALLLYASTDGHTVKILHFIAQKIEQHYDVVIKDLRTLDKVDCAVYDKVLVGASVRYGRLDKKLYQFAKKNALQLQKSNAAFFCVNLTARKQGKDSVQTCSYMQTFLQKSTWQPCKLDVFAGALSYPKYRWFDRVMIQFIMRLTGGETDPTASIEYTNWQRVEHFTGEVFSC
ncbi:MAG: menaquinone-dependent protoporphyrinogen IX dehydrogenase [Vibrionaceae bacterium]